MAQVSSLWSTTLPRGGTSVGGGSTSVDYILADANCLASDLPLNLVYVTGDDVGGLLQVATADPNNANKMPVRGILLSKSSLTECVVLLFGRYDTFSGLTANKQYWCGSSGTLVLQPTSVTYAQPMGSALSSDTFFFSPGIIYTL